MRPALALLALAALSGLAVLLVLGHGAWSGPTLWRLTATHGVNVGDLAVLGAWATGCASVLALARR